MDNWSAQGEYGPLFDGVTNRRFDTRVVHFELAKADNSDLALRGAIALNITGRIRQRSSPCRAIAQTVHDGGAGRLIQMPGGAKLASNSRPAREVTTASLLHPSGLAQIAHIEGISSLLNNTRQWLILRHDDMKELELFADRILLRRACGRRGQVPYSAQFAGGGRYSASCYFSRRLYHRFPDAPLFIQPHAA